ncbi:SusE domain-containing protein [Chryseolinea lacunae]|uniref:SusE domain-containing protein n=1 Tax=Chryseolinea lacunae TaxID=2801331 RepID=A0ABS1KM19_9BACT|nr:SusE domain-containing protein [Chryseolinea lacunae]MBL0740514.1 SusE domain-containing protein [Chryseolinea lacunae]
MKNTFILILNMIVALGMMACEDDVIKAKLKDDVAANTLQDPSKTSYVLTLDDAAKPLEEFSWTAPDFGFQAATTYTLQVDKAGNNFAGAIDLGTTGTLNTTVLVGAMNSKLLDLGFDPDEEASVEFRVKSTINANVAPLFSTVKSTKMTPYATTFPPIYMIGDALLGWDLPLAVETRSVAPSKYETIAEFHKGGKFRFFATLSWDAKPYNWPFFAGGSVDANLIEAGDGDGNFIFNGTSGFFRIVADTKLKVITMEAVEKPALMMIGDAVQGWDLAKAVQLTWLRDGVFTTSTTFNNNGIFRFFTKADWGAGTVNSASFTGAVDPLLQAVNDGDKNFKFVGTTASHKITVDLNNGTIVME